MGKASVVEQATSADGACAHGASFADEAPTLPVHGVPAMLTAVSAPPVGLVSGAVLCSRYVLEDVIGRGGISHVFRARDLHQVSSADGAAMPIAIKALRPELRGNRWALACLQREFRQMQRLSHPHIARVFDLGCDGDVWFISMELIVGQTVKMWYGTQSDPAMAVRIIEDCCAALEHAHSLGILHGDLKPTNVIVAEHGKAVLIDFGSMPEPGSRVPVGEFRTVAATPLYASPQMLMGLEAEGRDDVFSLACLSYAMLTGGRHPFGGRPSYEDGRIKSVPTYARSIAAELFKVIERGLSGDRERRQASVREFRLEMTAAGRRAQADAATPSSTQSIRRGAGDPVAPLDRANRIKTGTGTSWRTRLWAPLVAAGVVVVAIAVFFRHGTHGAERHATVPPMQSATPVSEVVREAGVQPLPAAATGPRLQDNGVVSFESSTVYATAAQSLIAIAVKRLGRTANRGAIKWRAARRSQDREIDYVGARTGLVRFNEGQGVRTLFIPLVKGPVTPSHGRRAFTVTLERVAGGGGGN
jgi:serine/threonine protein kinase